MAATALRGASIQAGRWKPAGRSCLEGASHSLDAAVTEGSIRHEALRKAGPGGIRVRTIDNTVVSANGAYRGKRGMQIRDQSP
jgi:hypothetical protein